jgi:AraC family transcriptional activator of pobA
MRVDETNLGIPLFGLYGESSVGPEPEFVHIEDVAARSRKLDWRIEAHRHGNLFQILCVYDGRSDLLLDEDSYSLASGSVVTIPPRVVHAFRFEPGTKGVVLTVAETLFGDAGNRSSEHRFEQLIESAQLIQFKCRSRLFRQLQSYLGLIAQEFRRPDAGHQVMLESLVKIVMTMLVRRLDETRLQKFANRSDSAMLMRFQTLVERHYSSQWPVHQYAAALNTSESSLNRRCKQYVGLTAKAIIQNRVIVEAKRKLIYTREPVDHVAYALGFKDPAYFSRFFKKLESVPPGEYRRSAMNRERTLSMTST